MSINLSVYSRLRCGCHPLTEYDLGHTSNHTTVGGDRPSSICIYQQGEILETLLPPSGPEFFPVDRVFGWL